MLVPVVSTSLNSRTTIKHGPTCEAAAPGVGVAGGASAGRVCRTVGHRSGFGRAKLRKFLSTIWKKFQAACCVA